MINNHFLARLHKQIIAKPTINFAGNCPVSAKIFMMRKLNGIQLSTEELQLITNTVQSQEKPRFLIFGLGNDSLYWHNMNRGGETVFLEDNEFWLGRVTSRNKELKAEKIDYRTKRKDWRLLLENPDMLEMELPESVTREKWDVVLVDAPAGYADDTSGRMQSIYMSAKLVKPDGDVFVHDCNREVEDVYSMKFLGKDNLVTEVKASIGNLRHFKMKK